MSVVRIFPLFRSGREVHQMQDSSARRTGRRRGGGHSVDGGVCHIGEAHQPTR